MNQYLLIGLVSIALSGLCYGKYEHYQFEEYKATEVKNALIKEHELADATDKIRKDKDDQISAINDQLSTALVQLRSRPARTDKVSINGQGRTGTSLFAEDAEFLERESARADTIRAALEYCYAQYDKVTK